MYDKKDKQEFLQILKNKRFNISEACRAFGINRKTFYDWMIADESYKRDYEDIKESAKDKAEDTLYKLVNGVAKYDKECNFIDWKIKPDTTALIFYLKTQCKDRGYIEKTEVKNEGEQKIIVEYYDAGEKIDG